MKNKYLIVKYLILLIILVVLIVLCKMSFIERFVDYVIAQYDNNKYKVQKYPNQLQAANTLAKINEKVNIPWINEEKEQELFEKLVDVMTDMLENVFKGK